jgi:hypothetical protein
LGSLRPRQAAAARASGRACPFRPERPAAVPAPFMITKDPQLTSGKSFTEGKSFGLWRK